MATALTVVGKSSLRPGQKKLYELIVGKLDSGDKITLKEAEQIWRSRVHSNMKDGVPHRVDYYAKRYTGQDGRMYFTSANVPMTQQEITERVLMWLTSNIGLLVIRGYLKVIPMIDVKQLSDSTPPH